MIRVANKTPEEVREFNQFLMDNNCYKEFRDNAHAVKPYSVFNTIDGDSTMEYAISMSFSWGSSPEGFYYWCVMSDKWGDVYNA